MDASVTPFRLLVLPGTNTKPCSGQRADLPFSINISRDVARRVNPPIHLVNWEGW